MHLRLAIVVLLAPAVFAQSWTDVGTTGVTTSRHVGIGRTPGTPFLDVQSPLSTQQVRITGLSGVMSMLVAGTDAQTIAYDAELGPTGQWIAQASTTLFITKFTGRLTIYGSGGNTVGQPAAVLPIMDLDLTTKAAKFYGNVNVTGDVSATGQIAANWQDVAEWVPATDTLAPGTVVVLDETQNNTVRASSKAYDTRVAGVISEQPGVILGQAGSGKARVATVGRVRVNVDATAKPVRIGDLLVTSDVPGTAMASQPIEIQGRQLHLPGTVIGKALEPLAAGEGQILVLLSLQ